jgi:hypothetical protein
MPVYAYSFLVTLIVGAIGLAIEYRALKRKEKQTSGKPEAADYSSFSKPQKDQSEQQQQLLQRSTYLSRATNFASFP